MAAPPNDKQSRLSTLSQDVIAVPRQPAPPAHAERHPRQEAPERPAERTERKEMPPSQDVFKVSAPEPPALPAARPRPAKRPPVRVAGSLLKERIPAATWVAAGVAGLALLVAGYAALSGGAADAAAAHAAQIAQFEVELKAATERIAGLEEQLSAASADADKLGAPGRINALQLSAGIRSLRNDLDMVSNEVAGIAVQIGEIRTLAAGGSKDAKLALAQIEQVGARVATISEQLAGAPRAGKGGGGDAQAQWKSLAQKTDKMAADIRQLYRQIGSQ